MPFLFSQKRWFPLQIFWRAHVCLVYSNRSVTFIKTDLYSFEYCFVYLCPVTLRIYPFISGLRYLWCGKKGKLKWNAFTPIVSSMIFLGFMVLLLNFKTNIMSFWVSTLLIRLDISSVLTCLNMAVRKYREGYTYVCSFIYSYYKPKN